MPWSEVIASKVSKSRGLQRSYEGRETVWCVCGVGGVHRVAAPSVVDKILICSLADSLTYFEHSHAFTPTDKLIISLKDNSPVA